MLFAPFPPPNERIHNHPSRDSADRRSKTEHDQMASGRSFRQPLLQQHGRQAESRRGLVNHNGEEDDQAQTRVRGRGRSAERDAVCGGVDDEAGGRRHAAGGLGQGDFDAAV